MIYRCANAYYFRTIWKIGGIESHLYYIARKYGNYDIMVFYEEGDVQQIKRLRKYIRAVKIQKDDFVECDKLFCCFNREILNRCNAKEKCLVLHGDYLDMVNKGQLSKSNLPIDDRIDTYYGVSQLVCDNWEKLTGIKAKNLYEPVIIDKKPKPLKFLSATRLTAEKGWDRMVILAKMLNEAKIDYKWDIYTNSEKTPVKNMVFRQPILDISSHMDEYDGFIQLSDNEGFCLSVVEALMNGTPVICTDLPVLKELGVNKDNSIILPFGMQNIPIQKIKDIKEMSFEYKPPEDLWGDVLIKNESQYTRQNISVRATENWSKKAIIDTELGHIPHENEEWVIDMRRYDTIREFEKANGFSLIIENSQSISKNTM